MPVEVGARGIRQHTPCLWLDLGQEVVAAQRFSQIPPFFSCCELLSVEIGRAQGVCGSGLGAGGTTPLEMHWGCISWGSVHCAGCCGLQIMSWLGIMHGAGFLSCLRSWNNWDLTFSSSPITWKWCRVTVVCDWSSLLLILKSMRVHASFAWSLVERLYSAQNLANSM